MDPGQLRYRVKIFQPNGTQASDFGDVNLEAGTDYWRFCNMIYKTASSGEDNSVEQFNNVVKFVFRYEYFFKTLKETATIIYEAEIFRINSIQFKGGGNKCYVEVIAKTFD